MNESADEVEKGGTGPRGIEEKFWAKLHLKA